MVIVLSENLVTISRAMEFLTLIYTVVGLNHNIYSMNSGRYLLDISLKLAYFIYCLGLVYLIIYSCLMELIYLDYEFSLAFLKGTVTYCIELITIMFSCTGGIVGNNYYSRDIAKTLAKLNSKQHVLNAKCDDEFKFFYLPLTTAILLLVAVLYDIWVWNEIIADMAGTYMFLQTLYFIILIMELKYAHIIIIILQQLRKINSLMNAYLMVTFHSCTTGHRRCVDPNSISYRNKICELLKFYHRLNIIINEDINVQFNMHNFSIILYLFEQIICCLLLASMGAKYFESDSSLHFMIVYSIWIAAAVGQFFILLWPCTLVRREAMLLKSILAKYMVFDVNSNNIALQNKIRLQLMTGDRFFSGFKIFNLIKLDLPAILMVMASASAYFFVILQL